MRYLLSCDWGTSTFRMYGIDIEKGEVMDHIESDSGAKKVYDLWSESQHVSKDAYFKSVLLDHIRKLEKKTGINYAGTSILASGMVSSTIGMTEVPYSDIPFSMEKPKLKIKTFKASLDFPFSLHLIGGLKSAGDIMRGEECQLLGMSDQMVNLNNYTVILPGTHSKHVFGNSQNIADFKSYLTGELYAIISNFSTLKNLLENRQIKINPNDHFIRGVNQGYHGNVLNELFRIRSESILNKHQKASNNHLLSGLLIGTELKELVDRNTILIPESGSLTPLYLAAFECLPLTNNVSTFSSKFIVPKGHLKIWNHNLKNYN